MVYERVRDPMLNRLVLIRSRFDDFRKFYQNLSVEVRCADGSLKNKSAGDFWLEHPRRRQYLRGVVFDPTGKVGPDYWNLWSGFGVEPNPGDWSLMHDHLFKVVCRCNRDHFDFLLNTTARMFQEPAKPAEAAVVLRGKKGAGKGVFCASLVKAWGQHGAHITNSKHLVGNFNNHLRDCVMLFADEAFFAGDRQHESVLKGLITEPTLPVEGKYMDVVLVRNMLHVYMSSNSDWVVPASYDERRYFVLDVLDTHLGDRLYFNALYKQMEEGGLAAMIYALLNERNISSFDPRDVPKTEALADQHRRSLDTLDRWWRSSAKWKPGPQASANTNSSSRLAAALPAIPSIPLTKPEHASPTSAASPGIGLPPSCSISTQQKEKRREQYRAVREISRPTNRGPRQ